MAKQNFRERRPVQVKNFDKGLTEQSHKDSCDIHNILKKYERTGIIEHTRKYEGQYMDFPDSIEFHDMMNRVAAAKSMFESIPASVRQKFHNDPGEFVDFMQDESNRDKIAEMGFSTEHLPPVEPPQAAEPAQPASPATEPPAKPQA